MERFFSGGSFLFPSSRITYDAVLNVVDVAVSDFLLIGMPAKLSRSTTINLLCACFDINAKNIGNVISYILALSIISI